MKIFKRQIVGVGLLLCFGLFASISIPRQAQASAPPQVTLGSNFTFTDSQHITGTINGNSVTFYDNNPADGNHNYAPQNIDLTTFCNPVTYWGINLAKNVNLTAASVSGTVVLGYENTVANSTTCVQIPSANISPSATIQISASAATASLVWQGNSIVSSNGNDTYTSTNVANVYINQAGAGSCEASGIVITSGPNSGTEYDLGNGVSAGGKGGGVGAPGTPLPPNLAQYLSLPNLCHLLRSEKVTIAGVQGTGGSGGTTCTSSSCQGGDTSACVFSNNSSIDTSLEWILCPVITGLSKSADFINQFVEGQLNFSVKNNLSGSVQNAWSVFRSLASALIVIVLLVMVISQAIGGGPFEAYTIRKLLPRLVAAIIIMQVSWELCTWLIKLSNDAGQGIGQLLAAPFGGTGNLDLPSLLNRLSGVWAAGISFVTVAGVITTAVFAGPILAFGWPILVLAVLLVLMAVIVAMATLLFRNALIILLVILSPLAFLAYVLPGSDRYWKIWRDNFTKLLIFFPLVMAMIYGGRIFAWTAGNLGAAGPLDVIMVLAGFFGPYFFLPKTFKWGGGLLAQASKGINESWPVKKGNEATRKGLMGRQQRKLNEFAKDLDPKRDGYVRKTGGKHFGLIPKFEGSLARTALWNARAGRVIPTKRGLASAIQRGETWNSEEDAIAAAKIKRMQDKAAAEDPNNPKANPTHTYSLGADGKVKGEINDNATARGKAALFNAAGSTDPRDAGMAVERALKTQSWVEMGKNLVPVLDDSAVNPNGLAAQIKNSGAEIFPANPAFPSTAGKFFVKMYDIPRYNSKVNASEDLYPLPLGKFILATPHITNPDNPKVSESVTRLYQEQENEVAAQENRAPARIAPVPHHIARAVETIRGYLDAGNITSQSEAEFQEFGRLAKEDPRVAQEFGGLLKRIASGGQGGINVLTTLASSASMNGTVNNILEAGGQSVDHPTLREYLQEGQQNIAGQGTQPAQQQPAAEPSRQQSFGAAAAPASAPFRTVQSGGEQVIYEQQPRVVQLQPGDGISPGGVVLSRTAQNEMNVQFEQLHKELRDLKKLGVRNEQQQSRLADIQAAHPDWQQDDEDQ